MTVLTEGLPSEAPVFLQACGLCTLPDATPLWQHQRQWHVLQAGFEGGLLFLSLWQAWLSDASRPERLFVTVINTQLPDSGQLARDLAQATDQRPELAPLATQLISAWQGLLPGMHRLVFEGGQVQLTLCLGLLEKTLRELDVAADSVFLSGPVFAQPTNTPSADTAPASTPLQTLQAVSRLCRTGSRLAFEQDKTPAATPTPQPSPAEWQQCGFELAPGRGDGLTRAVYAPAWASRKRLRLGEGNAHRQVLVIGAGLSGSAVAHSLAQRGWQVTVLDRAEGAGAGASGLPAGLTAAHVSPDDSVLSRITRAGVRATLQRTSPLLQAGTDWAPCGVLEHRVEGKRSLPTGEAWPAAGHDWSTPASAGQIADAGLAPGSPALWHGLAGWIRPRQLVAAQLQTPGVQVRWGQTVAQIRRVTPPDHTCPERADCVLWEALDAQGQTIAQAPLVVLASGFDTLSLLQQLAAPQGLSTVPLNPLRGQISFGLTDALPAALRAQLPPFPVNGHGSFISGVPTPDGQPGWYIGSTFERNCTHAPVRTEDHAANQQRLATLLPGLGEAMAEQFAPHSVYGWAGLRCTLPDRLPAVGPVDAQRYPGVWMSAGMGARGISLAVLCGELTAAWLEAEPLPLAPSLARHLAAGRFAK